MSGGGLIVPGAPPKWTTMTLGGRWRAVRRSEAARIALLVAGWLMIVVAPITAPLPGPGATILAVAGLSLVLRNSLWARRRYVRMKARYPKAGRWCDWGLRRPSYRRREAIARARAEPGPG